MLEHYRTCDLCRETVAAFLFVGGPLLALALLLVLL